MVSVTNIPVADRRRSGSLKTPTPDPSDELILFQNYFKSVGPRTYAVQVKQARNGNHALVLIEGKREPGEAAVRKHKVFIWSEDFVAFFKMLQETVSFIKANPVPQEVSQKRAKFWAKLAGAPGAPSRNSPPSPAPARMGPPVRTPYAPVARPPVTRSPVARPLIADPPLARPSATATAHPPSAPAPFRKGQSAPFTPSSARSTATRAR